MKNTAVKRAAIPIRPWHIRFHLLLGYKIKVGDLAAQATITKWEHKTV